MSSSHDDLEKGGSLSGEKEELVNTGVEVSDGILVIRPKNCCVRQWESLKRIPRWVRCLLIILLIITFYVLEAEYTIYAYDYNYPDPDDTSSIWTLLIVLGIIACCWGAAQ